MGGGIEGWFSVSVNRVSLSMSLSHLLVSLPCSCMCALMQWNWISSSKLDWEHRGGEERSIMQALVDVELMIDIVVSYKQQEISVITLFYLDQNPIVFESASLQARGSAPGCVRRHTDC